MNSRLQACRTRLPPAGDPENLLLVPSELRCALGLWARGQSWVLSSYLTSEQAVSPQLPEGHARRTGPRVPSCPLVQAAAELTMARDPRSSSLGCICPCLCCTPRMHTENRKLCSDPGCSLIWSLPTAILRNALGAVMAGDSSLRPLPSTLNV